MKRFLHTFALAMLILYLLCSASAPAAEQGEKNIAGKVRNKSLPNQTLNGLDIVLYRYADEKTSMVERTLTDATGGFSFQNLKGDKQTAYYLKTTYKGIDYFSRFIDIQEKSDAAVALNVYETTDKDGHIRVLIHHIFIEVKDEILQVREAMIVENKGNRVYVGAKELEPGKHETLKISLPEGAADLQHQQIMSPILLSSGEGFSDTMPVKPGKKRIIFSYRLEPERSQYTFIKEFYLPTDKVQFIFPADVMTAKSDRLQLRGPSVNSGQQLFFLSGDDFKKGSRVMIQLSLSKAKFLFTWAIYALIFLVLATGVVLSFRKRKAQPEPVNPAEEKPAEPDTGLMRQRQELLNEIAKLDDRVQSNDISTEAYHSTRNELLKKAKELTRQLQKTNSPEQE